MNYKMIALGTLVFFISSFLIQGVLGFVLAGDYFQSISIFRDTLIIYLAFIQTIITGMGFAILFSYTHFSGSPVLRGLKYGIIIGIIVVPFVALDLPARFMIPSMAQWITIQLGLGMLHYAAAGIFIGLIYKKNKMASGYKV